MLLQIFCMKIVCNKRLMKKFYSVAKKNILKNLQQNGCKKKLKKIIATKLLQK